MGGTKPSTPADRHAAASAHPGNDPGRPPLVKGRGAASNPAGRFETRTLQPFDDGWGGADALFDTRPKTTVGIDRSKSVITHNQSPDVPFDRSINPYRGCEHGCVYCFARPSHAYWGYGPGLEFETKLLMKPNAAELLAGELRRPKYACRPIAIGTNTDPYQPIEREHGIMRSVLQVLSEFSHPVSIVTKSALVMRDLDILGPMADRGLASVFVSVTTLDPKLARTLEPRAAAPHRRIETLAALCERGIPGGVMVAPVIPVLTDREIERILQAAADVGVTNAGYIFIRLPLEVKDLFKEWLENHVPDQAEHVMSLIRQSRDGKENSPEFGDRMRGKGVFADMIRSRFRAACRRRGMNKTEWTALRTDLFRPPPRAGDQMTLF